MTPRRTADTMSDAIALSSPNGRMSKRARIAAEKRLAVAIFGTDRVTEEMIKGTPPAQTLEQERESLLRRAREFRYFAANGMKPRVYTREALKLEAEAEAIRMEILAREVK